MTSEPLNQYTEICRNAIKIICKDKQNFRESTLRNTEPKVN